MEYLFVYGTLINNAKNKMAHYLSKNAIFIGKGYFYGELFEISWYPGAIVSKNKNNKVQGWIYKLNNPKAALYFFDDYEGIGSQYAEPYEYKREKTTIETDFNEKYTCWVYLYNWPTEALKRIEGGDFLSLNR